jgi:hypothetical protein
MAFQSGSQVNPALGRTDFTPFLQGAMQGAQAQARGAELIGQGLAGLGQQVASGIEKYYKKQEQKDIEKQGIEFIKSNVPGIDDKAASAGLKAAGGAAAFVNFMASQRQSQEATREKQQVDSLTEILRQGGGTIPAPISNEVARSFSPSTLNAARKQFLEQSKMEAEINKLNFRAPEKLTARVYSTAEEASAAGKAANPNSEVQVENVPGGFQFRASQRIVPDDETKFKLESFGKEVDRIIQTGEAARQVAPAINSLLGLLDSGKLQTGFGEGAKAQMRSVGKAIGFPVDEAALGNAQQANAMFGQMILQYYQQTKGSISNAENILFQSFGPELGKSPEANKAILTFSKKRNELDRDLEKIAKDYRLGKLDRQQAQEKIVSRQERYDNDIGSLIPEVPAATNNPKPNQAAINYLQQNPNARAAFDAKYGAGAAKQVLGN